MRPSKKIQYHATLVLIIMSSNCISNHDLYENSDNTSNCIPEINKNILNNFIAGTPLHMKAQL